MRIIKIYNPDLPIYPAVVDAVRFKDLILTEAGEHPTNKKQVVIRDENLEVKHTSTIIQYLDEKYPHPGFFPYGPEKRALIRMALEELITSNLRNSIDIYQNMIPEENFFSGDHPSILDIFIYALTSNTTQWSKFRALFESY